MYARCRVFAALAAKHVEIAGMRIAMQRLLNLQCQAVHATAHVCCTCRQPDPHTRWWRYHPRNTVTTRRSVASPASRPVTAGSSARFGAAVGCSPITYTGTNTACGAGRRTPRRTWLRQFHSRPRLISYRRAISAMPTPGCSVSATIRSFSDALQRRGRSIPVMISIKLAASDLSGAHTSAL